MKKVLILLALSTAVACTASKKKEDAAATTTPPAEAATAKEAAKATKPTTASSQAATQCKTGSDTRSIEVKSEGNGCEVLYTKMGETNSVASSVNGTDHCNTVAERIKTNLTNAGFTCE